jgi:hypothetical protein
MLRGLGGATGDKKIEEDFLTAIYMIIGKDRNAIDVMKRDLNDVNGPLKTEKGSYWGKSVSTKDVTYYEELLASPMIRKLTHFRELISKGDDRLKDIKIRNKEYAKLYLMLTNPTIDIEELDNVDVTNVYATINERSKDIKNVLESARETENKENAEWFDRESNQDSINKLNEKRKLANDLLKETDLYFEKNNDENALTKCLVPTFGGDGEVSEPTVTPDTVSVLKKDSSIETSVPESPPLPEPLLPVATSNIIPAKETGLRPDDHQRLRWKLFIKEENESWKDTLEKSDVYISDLKLKLKNEKDKWSDSCDYRPSMFKSADKEKITFNNRTLSSYKLGFAGQDPVLGSGWIQTMRSPVYLISSEQYTNGIDQVLTLQEGGTFQTANKVANVTIKYFGRRLTPEESEVPLFSGPGRIGSDGTNEKVANVRRLDDLILNLQLIEDKQNLKEGDPIYFVKFEQRIDCAYTSMKFTLETYDSNTHVSNKTNDKSQCLSGLTNRAYSKTMVDDMIKAIMESPSTPAKGGSRKRRHGKRNSKSKKNHKK